MKREGSSGLVVLLLAASLAACASLPAQEMSDARQAIEAARAAGGDRYTPQTLEQAETLISVAIREASEGDYRAARLAARRAKQQAVIAREAAMSVQVVN